MNASFGRKRTFVDEIRTPHQKPPRTSNIRLINFTHLLAVNEETLNLTFLWLANTLKIDPMVGKLHKVSLSKGWGSSCRGSRFSFSVFSLQMLQAINHPTAGNKLYTTYQPGNQYNYWREINTVTITYIHMINKDNPFC